MEGAAYLARVVIYAPKKYMKRITGVMKPGGVGSVYLKVFGIQVFEGQLHLAIYLKAYLHVRFQSTILK